MRKMFITATAVTALGVAGCGAAEKIKSIVAPGAAPIAGDSFAIKNVRVFDGARVIEKTTVVVRDGKIAAIGPDAATDKLTVLDGRGETLLPGLIDSHVHAFSDESLTDALRFGVTTELDMFTNVDFLRAHQAQRDSLAKTAAADLYSAGILVTSPGGHGTEYGFPIPTITDPAQADDFVQARIAEGSDYIKIVYEPGLTSFTSISEDTLKAVVAAAHAHGKLAVVHISRLEPARQAIDAGADGLVHAFGDAPIDDAFLADIVAKKAFVTPTLVVIASAAGAGDGPSLLADKRLAPYASQSQRDELGASFGGIPDFKKIFNITLAEENVRKLKAAGVQILAGTDSPNPGTTFGLSLHGELKLLTDAGLAPTDALAAATRLPAERFHLTDRGQIAPGLRADLVLVDGDPTTDIEATRAIARVFKNGYELARPKTADIKSAAQKPALTAGLVSDFSTDLSSGFGAPWTVTTDQLANGDSVATLALADAGANGEKGALHVEGTVGGKFPFPWSGAGVFFSRDFKKAYDLSGYSKLTFMAKGDSRDVSVLFFSRTSKFRPALTLFPMTAEWTKVEIDLTSVKGLAADEVYGFAVTAGKPTGSFKFDLDDVKLE